MPAKKKYCELCAENPVDYPNIGICKTCYSFLYYWRDATPGQLIKHGKKIARWHHRMTKVLRQGIRRAA